MIVAVRPEMDMSLLPNKDMKGPLTASFIFHAAVVILSIVGLPLLARPPETVSSPPITIEFVELDKITQTNVPKPPAPKNPTPEKPEPPQPAPEAKLSPPDLFTPPPQPEVVPKDALPPPVVEKKPEVEKKPPPPVLKKPPVPKPEVKKPPEQDFQSLLKNLVVTEPSTNSAETEKLDPSNTAKPEPGQQAPLGERMTVSEEDALRHQLAQCWNVLAGAKFAEDLVVEVRVTVNPDRTVNQAMILDQGRYNRDTHFRAAADAALRSLKNPRCTPLMLPADKYDTWKVTTIRFDPRDML